MVEKEIEYKFSKEVKKLGGIALKLVCPSFDGVPDRLVLMPGGKLYFVEVKRPGAKPRPLAMGFSLVGLEQGRASLNGPFRGKGAGRCKSYLKVSFREKFLKKNSHIRTY